MKASHALLTVSLGLACAEKRRNQTDHTVASPTKNQVSLVEATSVFSVSDSTVATNIIEFESCRPSGDCVSSYGQRHGHEHYTTALYPGDQQLRWRVCSLPEATLICKPWTSPIKVKGDGEFPEVRELYLQRVRLKKQLIDGAVSWWQQQKACGKPSSERLQRLYRFPQTTHWAALPQDQRPVGLESQLSLLYAAYPASPKPIHLLALEHTEGVRQLISDAAYETVGVSFQLSDEPSQATFDRPSEIFGQHHGSQFHMEAEGALILEGKILDTLVENNLAAQTDLSEIFVAWQNRFQKMNQKQRDGIRIADEIVKYSSRAGGSYAKFFYDDQLSIHEISEEVETAIKKKLSTRDLEYPFSKWQSVLAYIEPDEQLRQKTFSDLFEQFPEELTYRKISSIERLEELFGQNGKDLPGSAGEFAKLSQDRKTLLNALGFRPEPSRLALLEEAILNSVFGGFNAKAPIKYEDLSPAQKRAISYFGPTKVHLLLGNIKHEQLIPTNDTRGSLIQAILSIRKLYGSGGANRYSITSQLRLQEDINRHANIGRENDLIEALNRSKTGDMFWLLYGGLHMKSLRPRFTDLRAERKVGSYQINNFGMTGYFNKSESYAELKEDTGIRPQPKSTKRDKPGPKRKTQTKRLPTKQLHLVDSNCADAWNHYVYSSEELRSKLERLDYEVLQHFLAGRI